MIERFMDRLPGILCFLCGIWLLIIGNSAGMPVAFFGGFLLALQEL